MTVVGQWGGPCNTVAVSGNRAYIAMGPRLVVLDVTTPGNPSVLGTSEVMTDLVRGVAVSGNYAYVADGDGGLLVLGIGLAASPKVTGIRPNTGANTGAVNVTHLPGATVRLTKDGQSDIMASAVNVVSAIDITCTLDLTGAAVGQWNVVVTNQDGQSATLTNGFTVTNDPPVISSTMVMGPWIVARGDVVRVMAFVSDDVAVTGVTANGVALTNTYGPLWMGEFPVDDALGLHTVTVIAHDAAGNSATNTDSSYRTARVFAITNRDLATRLPEGSAAMYQFTVFGRVTRIDENVFELDDGSGIHLQVCATHDLQTGDYATARGLWVLDATPPSLYSWTVRKLQTGP